VVKFAILFSTIPNPVIPLFAIGHGKDTGKSKRTIAIFHRIINVFLGNLLIATERITTTNIIKIAPEIVI
jgi:hypothetical protein